ncbi:MAG: carbamoyltransferase C-terminal domain-containing protein, partial [Candidatus Omnitrophota bacterium]
EMTVFYLTEHPATKGVKHLALAGGIALNIMTNGKLIEKGVIDADKIFVPAYPADDGAPIGAALSVADEEYDQDVKHQLSRISLGREYSDEEIRMALTRFGLVEGKDYEVLTSDRDIVDRVAGAVMDDKTVAWFQGGSELGPRALGNRSILNRLDDPQGNLKVNRIKGRELWRPSAMSIQEERAAEFLDGVKTSPFMTIAFPVRSEKKGVIKAGAHPADGTTRPQTVSRDANLLYWSLLDEMGRLSGVPGVLNTSFNRVGPIVETPEDALNTFFYGDGLDLMSIGHFWIKRKAGIVPSIINARDEATLRGPLSKAISDGYPQSASWDIFWEKANVLARSRGSGNQHYLIIYTDDNGKEREVLRVPLVKEMFQDGSKQVMIANLANRIQRELPDKAASAVAVETTAAEYADVITDLFRQFTPAEIKRKWDIVKFGYEPSAASGEADQLKTADPDQVISELSEKISAWKSEEHTRPMLAAISGSSSNSRKSVARGLSGVCHVISTQRWLLDKIERNINLDYPFSHVDFNAFAGAMERLHNGDTALIPMQRKIASAAPKRGFALLSYGDRKKIEGILVKKDSKVWVRHDGYLFEQVVPEPSDVFLINSSFSVNYPVMRKAFSNIYSVSFKPIDTVQAKIAAQMHEGDLETPIEFSGLNEYLEALPMDEARDLFFSVDLLVKKNGMARSDVQVRYIFLKLLARGRNEFLDSSISLSGSAKQKILDVTKENGWMYGYVGAAIYHSLVEDGSIRDIKKKQLLNAPKIFFVSPVRPTAKDDKYGHYIGAGYFKFQQTSQIIAASYLDIFGLQAEVFDLSFGDKEVERLKDSIDDRTSVITLRLNGPITQADLDTIFMIDETIKDKFSDGERPPVLMAGGRSASFRAQELLEVTPIKAVFRGLSETDLVNIACNPNFDRTRSLESLRGIANVYTDSSVKPQALKRRKSLSGMQLETSFAVADFRKVDLRQCWKDLPKGNLHPETKPFAQPSILLFTGYPDVCMRGCEFCHYYLGGEASLRVSPEAVVDLMKRIVDIYPEVKLFNMTDGDMLSDRDWIERFADCFEREGLKEKGIKFLAYAFVSSCKDEEYLKMLKNKLNVETITFGEEVASVELLRDMRKLKSDDDPTDLVRVPALAMRTGIPYVRTTFILYYPTITQAQLMDSVRMITDFTEKGFNVSVNPYVLPRPPAPLARSGKAEALTVSYALPNGKYFTLEDIFIPNDKLIAEVAERSIAGLRDEVAAILKESGWSELEALGWKDSMAEVPPQVEVLALVRQTVKNLMERNDSQIPQPELREALDGINLATRNFMDRSVKQVREQVSRQGRAETEFEERQRRRGGEVADAIKIWNVAGKKGRRAKIIAVEVTAWGDSGYDAKASDFMLALQHLVNSMKPEGVVEDIEIVVANSSRGLAERVAEAKRKLKVSDDNIDVAILATEKTIVSADLKDLRSDHAFLAYVDKEMIKESCMDIMLPETITALVRKLTGFMGIAEINAQLKGILTIELDAEISRSLGVAIYRIIPNAKKLDIGEFERIFNLQTKEIERQA